MVIASVFHSSSANGQITQSQTDWPEYLVRCCSNPTSISRIPRVLNRHDGCMQHLKVSADSLSVSYIGRGQDDTEAAAIRTDAPLPPMNSVAFYYFEVTVLNKGQDGYLSLGLMSGRAALDKLVGWDQESVGWHGDDGLLFRGNPGHGETFGPTWGKDDVVGCGVDFIDSKVFFVKNGVIAGYTEMPKAASLVDVNTVWFPAVGLRTFNERLQINLLGPFTFDINLHVSRKTFKLCKVIANRPINSADPSILDLLLFYLVYHGYENTFNLLINELQKKFTPWQIQQLKKYFELKRIQREIYHLISCGQVIPAKSLLQASFPQIWQRPIIQTFICGITLLENAFSPSPSLKNLLNNANQLAKLQTQSGQESLAFFEVNFESLLYF